jgi:hypothetical protein
MERVAPRQVNYDNVLPLAIESRSNRREFLPVNGQSFSNTTGATICRIDINADSMLDATHSYLECQLRNDNTLADNRLSPNPFCPAWIQRLRIESGGVVIEDINEYSRLYAMLVLQQCPASYVKNNLSNQGLYREVPSGNFKPTGAGAVANRFLPTMGAVEGATAGTSAGNSRADACVQGVSELMYSPSAQTLLLGPRVDMTNALPTVAADNQPNAAGLTIQDYHRIGSTAVRTQCFPLVSGFLNMDKYIPLVMMNAGFTLELTLCDANRIGITQVEEAGEDQSVPSASVWSVQSIKYVAHLIDLDRSFYDKLRAVMESSGGVLQLAGQTYRHFVGELPTGQGPHTITIPARVKSVKSIFGTFIDSTQVGGTGEYDTSVFQHANLDTYRFEIGSVRYPQTDVKASSVENEVELQKAWGRLGDYNHQQSYSNKHTQNAQEHRNGTSYAKSLLSAYSIGYDFEAFQRVALEAGINTADRSLPINFICTKSGATNNTTRADFFVLTDAIYYINLDGTVSVSI